MTNVINKCVNSSMKKILLGFFTILGKSYRTFVEALLFPIAQTINICFLTVESKHLIVFFVFFSLHWLDTLSMPKKNMMIWKSYFSRWGIMIINGLYVCIWIWQILWRDNQEAMQSINAYYAHDITVSNTDIALGTPPMLFLK